VPRSGRGQPRSVAQATACAAARTLSAAIVVRNRHKLAAGFGWPASDHKRGADQEAAAETKHFGRALAISCSGRDRAGRSQDRRCAGKLVNTQVRRSDPTRTGAAPAA